VSVERAAARLADRLDADLGPEHCFAIGVEGRTIAVWLGLPVDPITNLTFQRLSSQIPSTFDGFSVKVRRADVDELQKLSEAIDHD
jgi:hypothetical protein